MLRICTSDPSKERERTESERVERNIVQQSSPSHVFSETCSHPWSLRLPQAIKLPPMALSNFPVTPWTWTDRDALERRDYLSLKTLENALTRLARGLCHTLTPPSLDLMYRVRQLLRLLSAPSSSTPPRQHALCAVCPSSLLKTETDVHADRGTLHQPLDILPPLSADRPPDTSSRLISRLRNAQDAFEVLSGVSDVRSSKSCPGRTCRR
ncbi:hypothetical protein DFH06DRAFT_690859 [Mycena polygramma]|nr:hypothetical protein DFH06DRAFT_690859 [Mycena polygramma]